jgi:AcrR family transcriptional regulator
MRGLRADAQQNRGRIIEIAGRLFAERGLDVPMAAIARHAGVGVATLYRRFPTRESLISEVFDEQFAACSSVVDEALSDPDPWRGFCAGIAKGCEMQAADRGFSAAVITAFPGMLDIGSQEDRALAGFAEVIRRAKQAGRLRADFAVEDVALLLMANNGIISDNTETAVAASRRLVAYLLNSFRAENAGPLPPSAPLELRDILTFHGRVRRG